MCNGTTKQGNPCRTKFGLDAHGFCQWHSPTAPQCRGTKKGTTQRCKIKGKRVNANGYCDYHKHEAPGPEPFVPAYDLHRCSAVAHSTGEQCRKDWEMYPNGVCRYHQAQAPAITKTRTPHADTQQAGTRWAGRVHQRMTRCNEV